MVERELSKASDFLAALVIGAAVVINTTNSTVAQVASGQEDIGDPQLIGSGFRGSIATDPVPDDGGEGYRPDTGSVGENTDQSRSSGNANIPLPLSARTQQAASRAGQVAADPDGPSSSPRANNAVDPVQTGTGQSVEDDPFAPTGFRLGTFNASAYLEQSIGYSSNISQQAGGQGGAFSQTDLGLNLVSDWSRHQLLINLIGSYRLPFDSEEVDDPSFFADSTLRLDLADGHSLTSMVYYQLQTEEFSSSNLAPGAVDTPIQQAFGGSLELARQNRKLRFSLRGSVDRNIYEDVDLGGGLTQSQADRANNLYQLTARVGYEISPTFVPFIEGIYGIRDFDEPVDRNGNRRDSDIAELRGGVEFDMGEKLQGELSVGYATEEFDDPLLQDLSGVTVNGQIDWSPQRGTLVSLSAGTTLNTSTALNDSGSVIYDARLDYERQITNRLAINWFAGIELEDNVDQDTTIELGVGSEYSLNRHVALTLDLEYLSFSSGAANSDYDETSGRIGMRFQR